ncbi:MAG: histidine phosphatase family protein [Solirubrobacterales bacterium]|nr:histidine phosphatase family protein [Solirubrobacterales bacterium]
MGGRIEDRMHTSKRLFILRHAKSSWDDPGLDDHERPLAPRGRRAVAAIASHVAARGIEPEVVLCSSSRRTRETLDGIGVGGEHLIEEELFSATCEETIERLRQLPASVSEAMLIGHNPTIQMVVLKLTNHDSDGADDPTRDEVKRKFPTGALATLALDCEWAELAPGCARLEAFTSPKEFSAAPEGASAAPARLAWTAAR